MWKNRADFTTPNQDAKPQKTGNFSELGHVRILTSLGHEPALTKLATLPETTRQIHLRGTVRRLVVEIGRN
jgi:hypothetical protein